MNISQYVFDKSRRDEWPTGSAFKALQGKRAPCNGSGTLGEEFISISSIKRMSRGPDMGPEFSFKGSEVRALAL